MSKQLHTPCMGIEETKFRAIDSMFCPGVNRELEDMIKLCKVCIKN